MSDETTAAPEPEYAPIPLHEMLALEHDVPDSGAGRAEVRMPVAPAALGFTGALHGGAIATMVDLACALAAADISDFDPFRESLVTVDMHVRYLGRPRTDVVVARAEVVKKGKQLIVVSCEVVDEEGHLVAVADFSMMIVTLRTPLDAPPDEGAATPPAPGAPEL